MGVTVLQLNFIYQKKQQAVLGYSYPSISLEVDVFTQSFIVTLQNLGNELRSRRYTIKVCAKMEERGHCHKTKRKDGMGNHWRKL